MLTRRRRPSSTLDRSFNRQEPAREKVTQRSESGSSPARSGAQPAGSSYSSYQTAEERAAFIKQQAEQRMHERLAALGLKPPAKQGSVSTQKLETDNFERERRLKKAEEQDARRDQERQRRLADETPTPPFTTKQAQGKKPAPPPSRGARTGLASQQLEAKRKADKDAIKEKEQEGREKAIKDQQEAQEAQTRQLEYVLAHIPKPDRLI